MKRRWCALIAVLMAGQANAMEKIVIGSVATLGDGPLICALERGYFREQNIDADITPFRSGADMVPLIVRGDLQMMGGAMSASFFNAIASGMPIRYFSNRAQSPVHHALILRKEIALRVKAIKDLKGLKFATTGSGTQLEYETAKVLAAGGLTMDDIDAKTLGMPETVAALKTGAIDASLLVPPLDALAVKDGGVRFLDSDDVIQPPMEVSGIFYNLDWARKNQDALDRFTIAYIKGARCHHEAALHGANRAEMIGYLVKHTPINDPAVYERMEWGDANPDGAILTDSVMDMQNFYDRRGYIKQVLPIEKIVDLGPVKRAIEKLGLYKR
jgi:NitT/TauT family transport system substrate-binding protein